MNEQNNDSIAYAIRMLGKTDRYHRAAIESHVDRLGVHRTQHIILMHIAHSESPISQGDIAKAFDVSPATIAVTLRKMESAGLIERISSKEDARRNTICLTEAGKNMIAQTNKLFSSVDEAMFNGISKEEIAVFTDILLRTQQNLKEYTPEISDLQPHRMPPIPKERKKK